MIMPNRSYRVKINNKNTNLSPLERFELKTYGLDCGLLKSEIGEIIYYLYISIETDHLYQSSIRYDGERTDLYIWRNTDSNVMRRSFGEVCRFVSHSFTNFCKLQQLCISI